MANLNSTSKQDPKNFRRWPENQKPYYPELVVWTWTRLPNGSYVFPSIECPEDPGNYDIVHLGQDYDGTWVAMITNGPEMGKTFITAFSPNSTGSMFIPRH